MARPGKELTKGWLLDAGVIKVTETNITVFDGRLKQYVVKTPFVQISRNPGKTQSRFYMLHGRQISFNRLIYAWNHEVAEAGKFCNSKDHDSLRVPGDAVTNNVNSRPKKGRHIYYYQDKNGNIYRSWSDVIRMGLSIRTTWGEYQRMTPKHQREFIRIDVEE